MADPQRAEIDTRTAGAEPIRLSPVKGCRLLLDKEVGEDLIRITTRDPIAGRSAIGQRARGIVPPSAS